VARSQDRSHEQSELSPYDGDISAVVARLEQARWHPRGSAHGRAVDEIVREHRLNARVIEIASRPRTNPAAPLRVVRTPMALGLSSLFLNRVDLFLADGSLVQFVEKGVQSKSREVAFWLGMGKALTAAGPHYEVVAPLGLVVLEPLAVLHFPYIPTVNRTTRQERSLYRDKMDIVVRAVVDFNAQNTVSEPTGRWLGGSPFRADPDLPNLESLKRRLGVDSHAANALRSELAHIIERWPVIRKCYEELPACVCHNDLGPGNVIFSSDVTRILDFGMATGGPLGSDLHALIRWSSFLTDATKAEEVIRSYADLLISSGVDVTHQDVRVAAWTTFFLRYCDLRWRSARNRDAFEAAIRGMKRLMDQLEVRR
jgi:hypothetical protein